MTAEHIANRITSERSNYGALYNMHEEYFSVYFSFLITCLPDFLFPDSPPPLSLEAVDDRLSFLPSVDPDTPILVVHISIPVYK